MLLFFSLFLWIGSSSIHFWKYCSSSQLAHNIVWFPGVHIIHFWSKMGSGLKVHLGGMKIHFLWHCELFFCVRLLHFYNYNYNLLHNYNYNNNMARLVLITTFGIVLDGIIWTPAGFWFYLSVWSDFQSGSDPVLNLILIIFLVLIFYFLWVWLLIWFRFSFKSGIHNSFCCSKKFFVSILILVQIKF